MAVQGYTKRRLIQEGVGSLFLLGGAQVSALGLGVVLARGLGAEGYGIYAYALAWLSVLLVPAELGMPTLLVREVSAQITRRQYGLLRKLISWSFCWVGGVAIGIMLVGMLSLWLFKQEGLPQERMATFYWAFALLPVLALFRTAIGAIRGLHLVLQAQLLEQFLRPVMMLLVLSVLFVVLPSSRTPQNAMTAQWAVIITLLIIALWLLFPRLAPVIPEARENFQKRKWMASVLPFTMAAAAGMLNSHADILMLGLLRSSEEEGIYRVAVQGSTLVALGLQAVNAVVGSRYARFYAQRNLDRLQQLVTLSARMAFFAALPFGVIFVVAGGPIVVGVFGQEYEASRLPLIILSVGQLVNVAVGSVALLLNMTGYERQVARFLLFATVINMLLNVPLIYLYGVNGAAIANAITLILWNLVLYRQVHHRLNICSAIWCCQK